MAADLRPERAGHRSAVRRRRLLAAALHFELVWLLLVPIALTIEAPMDAAGRKAVLDAGPIAPQVIHSPIFARYGFASGSTQYADAIMRADFYKEGGNGNWHTLLAQPKVVPVKIDVPVGLGYVLTSKKTGRMLANRSNSRRSRTLMER